MRFMPRIKYRPEPFPRPGWQGANAAPVDVEDNDEDDEDEEEDGDYEEDWDEEEDDEEEEEEPEIQASAQVAAALQRSESTHQSKKPKGNTAPRVSSDATCTDERMLGSNDPMKDAGRDLCA